MVRPGDAHGSPGTACHRAAFNQGPRSKVSARARIPLVGLVFSRKMLAALTAVFLPVAARGVHGPNDEVLKAARTLADRPSHTDMSGTAGSAEPRGAVAAADAALATLPRQRAISRGLLGTRTAFRQATALTDLPDRRTPSRFGLFKRLQRGGLGLGNLRIGARLDALLDDVGAQVCF